MLYWKIMFNSVQSNTAYRFHSFVSTFNRILNVIVNVSLWTALYAGVNLVSSEVNISLEDMITYAILSTFVTILIQNGNIGSISSKVQSGEIAIYMIRPIGLFRALLFEEVGRKIFVVIFEALPVLIFGSFIFGVHFPDTIHLLLFVLTLLHAFLIYFMITFILGLLSFWYIRVFHLEFMLNHVMNFFSGVFIPLWFFPDILVTVSSVLPFELIYFGPMTIFLEQASMSEIGTMLIKTYIWIGLIAALCMFIHRKAIRMLVVQGG